MSRVDQYFEFKCWKGLTNRGLDGKEDYRARLSFEIQTILKMGFAGYFLIVADFINWSRSQNIPVGPGRGSAAGSLVAYSLGITNVNPIPLGLLFERFLNPDRVSMPDIDCDFCEKRRDEVIQYVINKYGKDFVAQIGTFGTMKARGAIRDVARTLGMPLLVADKLAKLIPPPVHGKPVPIVKAIKEVPELAVYAADVSSQEGQILKWASRLEGTIRSYGIHASGVVISPRALTELLPLAHGKDGTQATQLEMNAVEDVGLIKFDFLGLRTLTLIKHCCDLIKEHHGIVIDPENIPQDDDEVFENLRQGDTCAIFQLETSSGIRDLMIKQIPRHIEDIIALVAMYRPGPLGSEGMKMYLDARAGRAKATYVAEELEPILGPTEGWLIYQESAMAIARTIAGFTLAEADLMRRAIGKKKEKEMAVLEQKFVEGALSRGFSAKVAAGLYADIKAFADYGFNKSHAAAYGYITYQTAYLKTHYPVEFMCAALTSDYGSVDKVIKYIADCKRMGIQILPPDVNQSFSGFTIVDKTDKTGKGSLGSIRFGLSAIKNLGEEPVSHITSVRGEGYKDIIDFCNRVDLGKINRKKLESLVLAGAFDFGVYTRTSMLATIDRIWEYREDMKRYESKFITFNKKVEACVIRDVEIKVAELAGKKKPNKLKAPEKPLEPILPEIVKLQEMDEQEMLSHERELLGFYVSGHPLDIYSSTINAGDFHNIDDVTDLAHGQQASVACLIGSFMEKQTKKGDTMAFATVEDKTGAIDVVFFATTYTKFKHIITSGKPLMIRGKVEITTAGEDGIPEDEDKSAKIIGFDVSELVSGKVKYEPIKVMIAPERSTEFVQLLAKYPGDTTQVDVFLKTSDNSLFKVNKIYSIGGSKNAFLRDLGRIIS